MKKLVYLLSYSLLLSAGFSMCSCEADEPSEQPTTRQVEQPADSIGVSNPTDVDESFHHVIESSVLFGKWQLISQPGLDLTYRVEILELDESMTFYESVNSNETGKGMFYLPDEFIAYNDSIQRYEGQAYDIKKNNQTALNDTLLYHVYLSQNTDTLTLFPDFMKGVLSIISAWKTYCRIK